MELRTFYFQMPPITRYYITIIFIFAIIATYLKPLQIIIYYIFLDYDLIFKSFQFWRLFTNLFFIGGFSSSFLMFVLMIYIIYRPQELNAIILRTYAQFIMMILYLLIFINIINLIALKIFGLKIGFTLAQQLLLSFIYIDSKREPQKTVALYFIKMKNAYFPYALILLNIVSGGGIYDNIIGIIAGNIYFVLKEVLPVSKSLDILKTPKSMVDFFEKYYYNRIQREDPDDNNDNGNNNVNNNNRFRNGNIGGMFRGRGGLNNNINRGF